MTPRANIQRGLSFLKRRGFAATAAEVWRRFAHRLSAGDTPSSIHLEISNCCNLHCEYCVLDQNAEGDKIMREQTFSTVLPDVRHARRIDLSGLAEPLMNKRFTSILAQVREQAPHAFISMCSNLTLLTPQIAEKIVENCLDEIVFSLDGVDPRAVDAVRRGGSLDTVLENVRLLQQTKERMGSPRPVLNATVVLQRKNVNTLPAIVELAAELGCAGASVNGLEPYEQSLVSETLWTHPSEPALLDAVARAGRTAQRLGIELRLPALQPQAPACPQASRPMVLADGTVVPCSVLAYHRPVLLTIDDRREVQSETSDVERRSFGNINDNGLQAIWKSDEYRQFRKEVLAGQYPAECRSCLMKHSVVCPTPPLSAGESLATARDTAASEGEAEPEPTTEARS